MKPSLIDAIGFDGVCWAETEPATSIARLWTMQVLIRLAMAGFGLLRSGSLPQKSRCIVGLGQGPANLCILAGSHVGNPVSEFLTLLGVLSARSIGWRIAAGWCLQSRIDCRGRKRSASGRRAHDSRLGGSGVGNVETLNGLSRCRGRARGGGQICVFHLWRTLDLILPLGRYPRNGANVGFGTGCSRRRRGRQLA